MIVHWTRPASCNNLLCFSPTVSPVVTNDLVYHHHMGAHFHFREFRDDFRFLYHFSKISKKTELPQICDVTSGAIPTAYVP